MIKLRPYQVKAVDDIRESYRSGKRAPLFVLPTGGGKTITFVDLTQKMMSRKKRVLILVHRVELLKQTSQALTAFRVPHGLINQNFSPRYYERVQVASVQTVVNRLKYIARPDCIIIDECHHANANSWTKILNHFNTRILGVTATPVRGDGTGLGKPAGGHFDDLILGPSVSELIDMGNLVKPVIYAPIERLDLSGIKTRMGDYNSKELADAVDRADITGNAVEHYRKICPGVPAVAFCVNIAHAEHVADEFRRNGYRSEAVSGEMDERDRVRVLSGLGNGSIQVVTSCDLISEGTDIPTIGAAILLRPTQSEGLYLQQVGRALRPCEGKDRAVILDHVGNVITHGLPDEEREWSLDGEPKGKKRKKTAEELMKVVQCTECFAVHEPLPACPFCGNVYPEKSSVADMPSESDGELTEITEENKLLLKRKKRQEEAQAQTYEDLKRLEIQRGYKPGWAKYRWEARQAKKQSYSKAS